MGATILRSKQRLEKYIRTHEHEIPSPRFHPYFRNSLIFFSRFIVFHKKYKNFNWVSTNNTTFHSFLFYFIHFFFLYELTNEVLISIPKFRPLYITTSFDGIIPLNSITKLHSLCGNSGEFCNGGGGGGVESIL